MTEQEAIEVLKNNYPKMCKMVNGRYQGGFDNTECDFGQALTAAITALKEIQQCRMIKGATIKEIAETLGEYAKIGTVEECQKAMEKQKAKKCVEDSCPDYTHYKCPSCGKIQKQNMTI